MRPRGGPYERKECMKGGGRCAKIHELEEGHAKMYIVHVRARSKNTWGRAK